MTAEPQKAKEVYANANQVRQKLRQILIESEVFQNFVLELERKRACRAQLTTLLTGHGI